MDGAMRRALIVIVVLMGGALLHAGDAPGRSDAPATRPAIDPALLEELTELDARMERIGDVTADFEQQKHTAMLRRPLVSSGTVRVAGGRTRWDTRQPMPTVMLIDPRDVRMYYPQHKTLEIYALEQRLGQLAASPVPRLSVLREFFAIERTPVEELRDPDSRGRFLALRLTPLEPALARHLQQVRALIDLDAAVGVKLETTDADGEVTVIRFRNVRLNQGLTDADLELRVPEGTKVSRPLAGMEQ
jgi:outer membrane lipoprotein-sorting protein